MLPILLAQADPVSAIQEFGPYVGGVVVCAGLFIWNTIQMNAINRNLESNTKAITESNAELKSQLEGQVQAQRELAQSVHGLAEAIHHQAEVAAEELSLVREMMAKQDVLAVNQTTIMTNFQRVVDQLIDVVRGKGK
jgi:uncharacterized protein YktB (UPF0637 family)